MNFNDQSRSCHAERSEASLSGERCFATLSMTKYDRSRLLIIIIAPYNFFIYPDQGARVRTRARGRPQGYIICKRFCRSRGKGVDPGQGATARVAPTIYEYFK